MLFESNSAIHEHFGLVDGLRDNSGVFPSSSGLSRTLWRFSGTPAAPLSAEATRAGGQGAVMLRFGDSLGWLVQLFRCHEIGPVFALHLVATVDSSLGSCIPCQPLCAWIALGELTQPDG